MYAFFLIYALIFKFELQCSNASNKRVQVKSKIRKSRLNSENFTEVRIKGPIQLKMIESRNTLYQVKKKADSRSSPFYNPIDENEQRRQELKQLRIKSRTQETQIIRLKDQIKDLRQKALFYQEQLKVNSDGDDQEQSQIMKQVSTIPMIIQNKQLKQELAHIHEVNLTINGKNRELEALNRQLDSDLKRANTKIKQLQILENVRSEQFESELQQAKPIILEDNEQTQMVSEGLKKVLQFMREKLVTVSEGIFQKSANECQGQKKTNSYNIFVGYWEQLKKTKHLGFLALLQSCKSMKQLETVIKYQKQQTFDINDTKYRDTLNQWIISTLTQIKYMKESKGKMKEQKLFRLLGLRYRSKFPIQGQKYQMDQDVKNYFQDSIVREIQQMI